MRIIKIELQTIPWDENGIKVWQVKTTKPLQGYVEPILVIETTIRLTDVKMLVRHPCIVIEATLDIT